MNKKIRKEEKLVHFCSVLHNNILNSWLYFVFREYVAYITAGNNSILSGCVSMKILNVSTPSYEGDFIVVFILAHNSRNACKVVLLINYL
jgi:hypothetical protein